MASVPLMLLATASQAALDRSSRGRMTTWLRTPTRPLSRRQPQNFRLECPFVCPSVLAMASPHRLLVIFGRSAWRGEPRISGRDSASYVTILHEVLGSAL